MTCSEFLLPQFDSEIANSRRILECVPADKIGWKPHEKSMSLGRLAGHVAELPDFFTSMIQTDGIELATADWKPFDGKTRDEFLAKLESSAATARHALASATDERLGKNWDLTFKGKKVFGGPRTLLLPITIGHMVHHRGQLTVYLRLNNVKFPGVYGPSADEMSQFA